MKNPNETGAIRKSTRKKKMVSGTAELLATIYDHAPFAIMLVDANLRVHDMNRAARSGLPDALAGRSGLRCGDILRCENAVPESRTCGTGSACAACTVRRVVAETLETGKNRRLIEAKISHRRNGSITPVTLLLAAARLRTGEQNQVLLTYTDITEFKRLEEKVAWEHHLFQLLMDAVPDRIYFKDREGRYLHINRAKAERFGIRDPARAEGLTDFDFFSEEHARQARADEQRILETGEPIVNIEEKETWPDGRITWASTTKLPFRDPRGQLIGTFGVSRDITERIKSEEARREMDRQLQHTQKLESLGVLAGGIAHDFNNILMAILGNAELALEVLSPVSPARDNLRDIVTASHRAAGLCQQMLAYAGRGSFTMQPIDIGELISEMAHLLKASISKRAVLNIIIEDHLPPIQADPSQIRQVVMNLLINASEAIGDRSGVITISAGASLCDEEYLSATYMDDALAAGLYLHLEVADTGQGMDEETRAHIFEPFFTTKFTGRGLGMAAVLGIVRSHKGALKVYSEPGKGTTFKLLFPALEAGMATRDREPAAGEAPWRGRGTVLLADDEESLRSLGARMLERLGLKVITASDGREAVRLYRQHAERINLVLLDLTMPHMDGAQAFQALRSIRPNLPIVLASGYGRDDVAARFAGKGLTGVIQKPYSSSKLREVLKPLLPARDEPPSGNH